MDPYPAGEYSTTTVGLTREKVLGIEPGIFESVSEDSMQALGRFVREQRRFGIIHIDGGHKFDDVLIDFSLAALVCDFGGHIILDDLWMPSIQRAVSFILLNRPDFVEVRTPTPNVAVFRMTGSDTRVWDHYVPF